MSGLANVALVSVFTRGLDRSEYGIVEYVLVLQMLVQVIAGLELTQGIARFYGGAGTDDERRSYASTGLWSLVIAYGLACAVLFGAADPLQAVMLAGAGPTGVLRPALVSLFVAILFYAVRSQLRWELRPTTYAIAGLIAGILTVGLSAYLVIVLRAGIVGAFAGSAIGNAVALVWCLRGLAPTYTWTFDARKLARMLRFSAPLTLSTLALFVANSGDRVVIRTAMGFDDLGVYAAGAKVASAIALASAGFQLGAAPLIYRHHGKSDTPDALAQLLRMFLAMALIGVLGLAALSIELIAVITTPAYADAWRVVAVLALATVLASGYIFLPGLTLRNMTARFAAINVVSAAVALTLITLLARWLGIPGAALGALGGAALGFGLHAAFSQRAYALPVEWTRIALAIAVVTTAIAITWALGRSGTAPLAARILTCTAATAVVVGLVLTRADRTLLARTLSAGFARSRTAA